MGDMQLGPLACCANQGKRASPFPANSMRSEVQCGAAKQLRRGGEPAHQWPRRHLLSPPLLRRSLNACSAERPNRLPITNSLRRRNSNQLSEPAMTSMGVLPNPTASFRTRAAGPDPSPLVGPRRGLRWETGEGNPLVPAKSEATGSRRLPRWTVWRRGWDSNPRWALTHASFQDWSLKPLGHLSVPVFYQAPTTKRPAD
jgi:hypothetical protein